MIKSRFCAFLFAFSTTSCKSGTLEKNKKQVYYLFILSGLKCGANDTNPGRKRN